MMICQRKRKKKNNLDLSTYYYVRFRSIQACDIKDNDDVTYKNELHNSLSSPLLSSPLLLDKYKVLPTTAKANCIKENKKLNVKYRSSSLSVIFLSAIFRQSVERFGQAF